MTQHFLLSANARHLSIAQVSEMSDIDILKMLIKARWQQSDNLHHVICPRCQKCHNAYFNATRQQWRCKYCHYCFSITAGTIFHGSKLSLKQLLIALLLFTLNAKWISAVELSHSLNVQYKTAWVLLHKFRETLNQTKDISL
nr:transposase [Psittacicella gerlachiana]